MPEPTHAQPTAQGDGIRPVETVPYKITRPLRQVRYARICPFCRKARGKIRKLGAASYVGGDQLGSAKVSMITKRL